jgi:hypothetical protein
MEYNSSFNDSFKIRLLVFIFIHQFTNCYGYGVVSYKTSHALRPFSDLLFVSIWVLTIPESSTRTVWKIPAETPSSESGETWREMAVNFADEISLSFFNMLLRHGTDGFTSPSERSRATDFYRPLKSIVIGRVWTHESWVQWQTR